MNWELARNLLFGLGLFALAIGLLLRFKRGRWLLGAIIVFITLGALLSGEPSALDSDFGSADPLKASQYWLWGGALSVASALLVNFLSKH
ncbi:MAG: hypothetical protein ACRYF0_19850 [Janthinobacterium lividum]